MVAYSRERLLAVSRQMMSARRPSLETVTSSTVAYRLVEMFFFVKACAFEPRQAMAAPKSALHAVHTSPRALP